MTTTATTPYSTTTVRPRFLLLGDCHAIAIGEATKAARVPFEGGPLGVGRDFVGRFVDVDGEAKFLKSEADQRYREHLSACGVTDLRALSVPLVSTFGFTLHTFAYVENWRIYRDGTDFAPGFLASPLFEQLVLAMVEPSLDFYRYVIAAGLRVLPVLPPQRVPDRSDRAVLLAAQEIVRTHFAALGLEMVDIRSKVIDSAGNQRPEFCHPESSIHGNRAFGRLVLAELIARGV